MPPLPASRADSDSADVSLDELTRRLHDPDVVILDVLPRESFDSGHIPGARSLPLAEVAARAPDMLPDRSQEIIAYCGGPT